MAFAALVSWLITEGIGAWMLRRWLLTGGLQRGSRTSGQGQRERGHAGWAEPSAGVPPEIVLGHAGLALAGFACWVGFVVSGSPVPAWLALGLLGPAIGLGVSTVTVWTPYPVRGSAGAGPPLRPGSRAQVVADPPSAETGVARLVDELVADLLAPPPPRPRRSERLAPLVPAAHGVAAVTTFLLVMLAAITS